jgi:uroporphyrinogen decarboxylase
LSQVIVCVQFLMAYSHTVGIISVIMDYRTPNIDRLYAAYSLKKHDRVPHFDMLDPKVTSEILGKESLHSHMLSPKDAIQLAKLTCQDSICRQFHYSPHPIIDGEIKLIQSRDDLEHIAPPDLNYFYETAKEACDAVSGTGIGVELMMSLPFFSTYMATGPIPIQSFMLMLYDDVNLIKDIFKLQTDHVISILETVRGLPVTTIELADDLCDHKGYMVNSKIIDELWKPQAQRIVDVAKTFKVPIQWHCCGKLDQLLPQLVEWGINAIAPIQAACNDIYRIKKDFGDAICLVGNMNIEGVLFQGTRNEIINDVKEHIDGLSQNGGYVVSSSHSIVDAIPKENYMTMVETAVDYGRYK